jgi:hypothetical protein
MKPYVVAGVAVSAAANEGVTMSDKSPRKANEKKQGKTLKEKQTAKKMKRIKQEGHVSTVPPTGH